MLWAMPGAAAFNKATEGFVGVDYVPVALLSTQTVEGTELRVPALCRRERLKVWKAMISATDRYVS